MPTETPAQTDLGTVSILLRRARSGCTESREQLLVQVTNYLTHLANHRSDKRLNGKVGASDIVQLSLIRASENFETFRGEHEGQWKAWLKMLLINEVRQTQRHFTRHKRSVARERPLEMPADSAGDAMSLQPAIGDQAPSPLSCVIRDEQLDQLTVALDSLSDDYRTVIRLRTLQRLPMSDVAAEMNRSVEATAKLWYRAIKKLRTVMPDVDTSR